MSLDQDCELGECPQAGCLQGGDEEFEHNREVYSVNNLVRDADEGILLFAVFLKHGGSEFSRVLMSTRFMDLYGVRDQRNKEITPEQELEIQIITEDKEAEVKAEEVLEEFLEERR